MGKNKNKNFYELVFSRECSVPAMEVWYIAENDFLFKILGKKLPKSGYMFFEYENGIAKNYLDMKMVEKFYGDIIKATLINSNYFYDIEKIFWSHFKKIKKYLAGKAIISNTKELKIFFKEVFCAWGAMVPSYWIAYFNSPLLPNSIIKRSEKIRLAIENIIFDFDHIFTKALKTIYKNNFYPDLIYATFNEIIENKIPGSKILKQRRAYSIYFKNKLFLDYLKVFLKKTKKNVQEIKNLENITKLKGIPAFRGFVEGITNLILSSKEIEKFKNGEILVAPNTSPAYMPAIIK